MRWLVSELTELFLAGVISNFSLVLHFLKLAKLIDIDFDVCVICLKLMCDIHSKKVFS